MAPVTLHDPPRDPPGVRLASERHAAFQRHVATIHTGEHVDIRAGCAKTSRFYGAIHQLLTETGGVMVRSCGFPPTAVGVPPQVPTLPRGRDTGVDPR